MPDSVSFVLFLLMMASAGLIVWKIVLQSEPGLLERFLAEPAPLPGASCPEREDSD